MEAIVKGKRKMSDWVRADRIGKMLLGILLIGMCVAAYRISLFEFGNQRISGD